jgi:hypothetical protein
VINQAAVLNKPNGRIAYPCINNGTNRLRAYSVTIAATISSVRAIVLAQFGMFDWRGRESPP